jgi:hypothetical protein
VDVDTANIEGNQTIYRLQQLDRDIYGCLKNAIGETEQGNTVLPPTADRSGKFAVWGTETGRLTYAGDPDEGGDDPTADYLKTYNNLSDLSDPTAARENLGVIQGHQINGLPQRNDLTISGVGVSAYNTSDATVISIAQTVRTFADILGVAAVTQGGTGATNAADGRKIWGCTK